MKLLPLHAGKKRNRRLVGYAKVDDSAFEFLCTFNWYVTEGYACRNSAGEPETQLAHEVMRFYRPEIFPLPEGIVIDHKNRDPLDNQKHNLRPATISQNNANQKLKITNTSGYKGVTWDKVNHKWIAQVQVNYKHKKLGRFSSKEAAAIAVNEAFAQFYPDIEAPNVVGAT